MCSSFLKHSSELLKMESPGHKELVPLAETTLAILRLSCERFFMLISVFVAYLIYRGRVPRWLKTVIRINHRLSKAFQKVRSPQRFVCSCCFTLRHLHSATYPNQSRKCH